MRKVLTIRTRMLNSETTKIEALFFSEVHLKTMVLDLRVMIFRTAVKTVGWARTLCVERSKETL